MPLTGTRVCVCMCFASLAGDTDSDHQLSFGELQAAMASLGLDLTDTHDTAAHDTTHENHVRAFRELWTQIDVTGRGTVSYEELLEALAPTKLILIPKGRGQHVAGAAIRERMRTGVNGSMRTAVTQLHDAFAEIATDRVIDVFRVRSHNHLYTCAPTLLPPTHTLRIVMLRAIVGRSPARCRCGLCLGSRCAHAGVGYRR